MASPRPRPAQLQPCRLPGLEEEVWCGSYEVYENRRLQGGRKLRLNVAVLPALTPQPAPDPLFFLAGGPGQGATSLANFAAETFTEVRRQRDLVLVDQRGTGRSNGLSCDMYKDSPDRITDWLPPAGVRACRRELARRADLRLYTTPLAVTDLDEVRAWLGYDRINLYGTSYGTRVALVYLRSHPERVRSVVLKGVAPLGFATARDYGRDAERALGLLFGDCAADATCRRAFPNLQAELQAVLHRLEAGLVRVELPAVQKSPARTIEISRWAFGESLRNLLYSPVTASQVPLFIHQAAEGNLAPIVEVALRYRQGFVSDVSFGQFLSVTCAEDIPRIDAEKAAREAAGTFADDYRLRQQARACRLWPRVRLPEEYFEPVRSDAPVLILSGGLDPVTPPRWGEEAARHLPASLHVVFRNGGHPFAGFQGCGDKLIAEFIARGSAKGLDTSCADKAPRPPFVLPAATP